MPKKEPLPGLRKHPLIVWRTLQDITRMRLSEAAGVSYSKVCTYETGIETAMPRKLRATLHALGCNTTALEADVMQWHEERQAIVLKMLRARQRERKQSQEPTP